MMKSAIAIAIIFVASVDWAPAAEPIDRLATSETKTLFKRLKSISGDKLLFGHQDAVYSGKDWIDTSGDLEKSDCKTATGSHPAIVGFDYYYGRDLFKNHVEKAFARGAIVTISWHAKNPANGLNNWSYGDPGDAVTKILNDETVRAEFNAMLDEVGEALKSYEYNGVKVPIIWRPFHENSHSAFWWGKKNCTADEYIALWRYCVEYLRDKLKVHNLLYAFSPSRPSGDNVGYFNRYPGDDYVDIIGFDRYGPDDYGPDLVADCRRVVQIAKDKGKVAAITESGIKNGIQNSTNPKYFTKTVLRPIMNDPVARNVAYWLTWRNWHDSPKSWLPLKGDLHFADFLDFYRSEITVFEEDLPEMYGFGELSGTR